MGDFLHHATVESVAHFYTSVREGHQSRFPCMHPDHSPQCISLCIRRRRFSCFENSHLQIDGQFCSINSILIYVSNMVVNERLYTDRATSHLLFIAES